MAAYSMGYNENIFYYVFCKTKECLYTLIFFVITLVLYTAWRTI